MMPKEAAAEIEQELDAALADLEAAGAAVEAVRPPEDLGADRFFVVTVRAPSGALREFRLPAPLAMGYLADEEAAVDEWRHWVRHIGELLGF